MSTNQRTIPTTGNDGVSKNMRSKKYHKRRQHQKKLNDIRRQERITIRNERIAKQKEDKLRADLQLFKCNLERAIHQNATIYEFIQEFKQFGTLTSVEMYAIEMGAPTTCSYDEYFWRIAALIHYMFKQERIEHIDQISITFATLLMAEPEGFYLNYCANIHTADIQRTTETEEHHKQSRMKNIVIETEYCQLSNSDTYTFECPICYESCEKLNSFETNCGHNYCEDCFTNYMMKLNLISIPSCPLCRTTLNNVSCYTEIIMSRK